MTCYAIISGHPPYAGRSNLIVIYSVLNQKLPPWEDNFSQYGGLWDLLQKCWHPNPEDRPTMHEICSSLRTQLEMDDVNTNRQLIAGRFHLHQTVACLSTDCKTTQEVNG